jgi:hypothetical protein
MIDVELQPDRLSGFITRLGDRESDEGTPLTFFFATSRLAGQRLAFTTRQVHGVWFSFEGTIVRGSARSRDQQGYYLLEGRLVMHDVASQTEQARMVSLPQYPNGSRSRHINTMRRGLFYSHNAHQYNGGAFPFLFFPIRLKRSFIWIAQQAQCGTAA